MCFHISQNSSLVNFHSSNFIAEYFYQTFKVFNRLVSSLHVKQKSSTLENVFNMKYEYNPEIQTWNLQCLSVKSLKNVCGVKSNW